MKASITEKWAVWHYHDVWRDVNDGWMVNDKMHITNVAMNIKSKEDVLAALKQVHLLKQEVTADMIEIPNGIGDVIEVDQAEDWRPIFKLECLGSFFPQAFHKEKNVVLDERDGNIASFRINGDIEIEAATIHKDGDGREYFVCGPDRFYIDEFEKMERE